jgi:D-alanine-D-alanine ligase
MRVGVTYDLRSDYLAMGYGEEETAEFDVPETIEAIAHALKGLGYAPVKIGNIRALAKALVNGERFDAIFNICEGLEGVAREAEVPALLEAYGIPYVFSDPLTLALALDKGMAKRVVRDQGVPTPNFIVIEDAQALTQLNLDELPVAFPVFAKPVREGSGKGIDENSHAASGEALRRVAADLLERFQQPVLVEEFLPGREFTVGIVGTGEDARVLGVTEIGRTDKFLGHGYGYRNKEYWEDKVVIRLAEDSASRAAADVALGAWKALRCRDGGRVDVRNDARDRPNFIEVNPLAGLRPSYSDLCFIADFKNIPYEGLIEMIMTSFLKRHPALKAPGRAAA